MIIDFHTHAFPQAIAQKAVQNDYIKAAIGGSYDDLIEVMDASGVDISLIMPVATKPGMYKGLNDNAIKLSQIYNNKLMSFGSVYPGEDNWDKAVDYVKEIGLKGIKIQPVFQRCKISDESVYELTKYATDIGLYVLIHVGKDYPTPPEEVATPKMASKLVESINNSNKIILAHLGGYNYPLDAFEYVAGQDCYLDTSMCKDDVGYELMYKIIEKHGCDKVLFGSDSPWYNQKNAVDDIHQLGLTEDELSKILYKNASKILGI